MTGANNDYKPSSVRFVEVKNSAMPVYDPNEKPCGPNESRCIVVDGDGGSRTFFCYNEPVPVCADCPGPGDYLCDYPVGNDKTCDRQMCECHAHEVAHEVHFCQGHFEQWQKFLKEGGLEPALQNIVRLQPKPVNIPVELEQGLRNIGKKQAFIRQYDSKTVTIGDKRYRRTTGHEAGVRYDLTAWRIGPEELARVNDLLSCLVGGQGR